MKLPDSNGGGLISANGNAHIDSESKVMLYEQDGVVEKASYTSYRGENAAFHPMDRSFESDRVVARYFMRGLAPKDPFLDERSSIVAFGSCFAGHISNYLFEIGYNVATKRGAAYVSTM